MKTWNGVSPILRHAAHNSAAFTSEQEEKNKPINVTVRGGQDATNAVEYREQHNATNAVEYREQQNANDEAQCIHTRPSQHHRQGLPTHLFCRLGSLPQLMSW